MAADHSEYNRFAAISALISIYLDDKNYVQAEGWSNRGLKYYPENRIFFMGSCHGAWIRQNQYANAVLAYSNLLANIVSAHAPHPYNEIVCRLNLAKSKIALNDTTTAFYHLKQILSYETCSFPPNIQSRATAKFEEARKLLSKLENQKKN